VNNESDTSNTENHRLEISNKNVNHSLIFAAGGDIRFDEKIYELIKDFNQIHTRTDTRTEPQQNKGLIEEYAWPDPITRAEIEIYFDTSPSDAIIIIDFLINREILILNKKLDIESDDCAAIAKGLLEHIQVKRENGYGYLGFEQWIQACDHYLLNINTCPRDWQRSPFNLDLLLTNHSKLISRVWDFLCQQGLIINQHRYSLLVAGLHTLETLFEILISEHMSLDENIDINQLLETLKLLGETHFPELLELQQKQAYILNHLSKREIELFDIINYYDQRNMLRYRWKEIIRDSYRKIVLMCLKAWLQQSTNDMETKEVDVKKILEEIKRAFTPLSIEIPYNNDLPPQILQIINKNPHLRENKLKTYCEIKLIQTKWELTLLKDFTDLRNLLLSYFVKYRTETLIQELDQFMNGHES
jgi:hypothetical protein